MHNDWFGNEFNQEMPALEATDLSHESGEMPNLSVAIEENKIPR